MVLFSSIVSYYLKSDKIWILFLDLVGNSEPDPGKSPPPPILLDQTEALRAEKKFFKTTPPYIRVWMTALLLSEGLDPPLQLVPLQHYT